MRLAESSPPRFLSRHPRPLSLLAAPLLVLALPAFAAATTPVVDGELDAAYGPALVTQTTQANWDATQGQAAGASGMELDAAYATISGGVLHLMFTGNFLLEPNPISPGTYSSPFQLFIDTRPGGQRTLRADNDSVSTGMNAYRQLHAVAGLTFDADFLPDVWLGCRGAGGPDFAAPYSLLGFFGELPSNAGAGVTYLGSVQVPGPNTLTGGSNPDGIAIALDNSNTAGVPQGCGASSGDGVTTGLELAIPLAALGNPSGALKVCAFFAYTYGAVSSQVLGPVPSGTCDLGAPASVDFSTLAGSQYFVVDPDPASVAPPAVLDIALAPRGNPGRGLTVTLSLPRSAPARLDVLDSSGRRVLVRELAGAAGGSRTLELARPGALAPGMYFLRLAQGASTATARAVITR